MSAERAGTLPAPHRHIAIEVIRWWSHRIFVTYSARPSELIAAGLVTAYMEQKILNQRAGCMMDEQRRRFEVLYQGSRKRKRDIWESGEPVRFRYQVYDEGALELPGMRELFPDGIPSEEDRPRIATFTDYAEQLASVLKRSYGIADTIAPRARAVGRFQRTVEWATIGGLIVAPNWRQLRVDTEVAKQTP